MELSGSGAYVVPLGNGDGGSRGGGDPSSADHIPDLSRGDFPGVSTRDLFPAFVARVNRVLLGMDVLGAGGARPAVHTPRYLLFWALFAGQNACQTTLIYYGLGIHAVPAAITGLITMAPMVALTAWVERDLYRSPVLGHRLLKQNDSKIKALQKSCASYFGMLAENLLFYQVPMVFLPSFLLVLPLLHASNSATGWFVLFWVSMGVNALLFIVSIWCWVWQPLIELHQDETVRLAQIFSTECLRMLDSKEMSPGMACEALGVLHKQLGKPLRDDIKHTFEPNVRGYAVGVIFNYIACTCLVLLPVDEDRIAATKDVVAPETLAGLRYGFAALMMVMMPLMLRNVLFGLRKVSMTWEQTVESALVSGATLRRAVQKFDGDARTFEMWLETNRVASRSACLATRWTRPCRAR